MKKIMLFVIFVLLACVDNNTKISNNKISQKKVKINKIDTLFINNKELCININDIDYYGPKTIEINNKDILLLETCSNAIVIIDEGKIINKLIIDQSFGKIIDIANFNNKIHVITELGYILIFNNDYILEKKIKLCKIASQSEFFKKDNKLYVFCPNNEKNKFFIITYKGNQIETKTIDGLNTYSSSIKFKKKLESEIRKKIFLNENIVKLQCDTIKLKKSFYNQGLGGKQYAWNINKFVNFTLSKDNKYIIIYTYICK